jgi:DNA-directed RNA polymerase subunit omega
MTRLEQVTAKAMERVNNDRYLLSKAIGKRAEQLGAGSTPLVDMDIKKYKAVDIALYEIAEGKLKVELEN